MFRFFRRRSVVVTPTQYLLQLSFLELQIISQALLFRRSGLDTPYELDVLISRIKELL